MKKYGYRHVGFKTEDGTVISKEVSAILLKGYTMLEAVWEAKKFTVNFYVGDSLYHTTTVDFGESVALPTLSDRDGATFLGWGADRLTGMFTLKEEGDVFLTAHFQDQTDGGAEFPDGSTGDSTGDSMDGTPGGTTDDADDT